MKGVFIVKQRALAQRAKQPLENRRSNAARAACIQVKAALSQFIISGWFAHGSLDRF
jgi:hypothetical protein